MCRPMAGLNLKNRCTCPAQADVLAGRQLLGAGAHVAWAVALGAGVAGLHDPLTPPAPQQPYSTARPSRTAPPARSRGRRQLPRSRAVLAWYYSQLISGMMVGDEHLHCSRGTTPTRACTCCGVGVDALLGAGKSGHECVGIGRGWSASRAPRDRWPSTGSPVRQVQGPPRPSAVPLRISTVSKKHPKRPVIQYGSDPGRVGDGNPRVAPDELQEHRSPP
jgi:hypothetical protein